MNNFFMGAFGGNREQPEVSKCSSDVQRHKNLTRENIFSVRTSFCSYFTCRIAPVAPSTFSCSWHLSHNCKESKHAKLRGCYEYLVPLQDDKILG